MSEQAAPVEAAESPAGTTSLDPCDWGEFRAQAHRMLDDMLDFTQDLRARPLWQVIPDAVRERFRSGALPAEPTALPAVHAEFMASILPYAAGNAHPGFMGWVQGGGTPVGMLAEMLAAGLNANTGGRDQIPLEVERQVTGWMRTVFDFPAEASGLCVSGTSMANFLAVIVARDAKLGCDLRRAGMARPALKPTAYASPAVHGSIGRALDLAGIGSDALRLVPTDSRHRIDLQVLREAIACDRAAGLTPFLVVGNAGTVDTGAIDDLDALSEFCAEQRLWFHVDGAFGALAMLTPELAPRLRGIEKADSLAFDFHKWAQVPYEAGFLLVRDGELHRQAFAMPCAYLARDQRGMAAGSPWPCDFGPELSRGFRALKIWATLKTYGTDAIGAVIRHSCELARALESRIASCPELELLAPVELNIVCFRYRFTGLRKTDELLNRLNRQIVIELQEGGAVAPSLTMLAGKVAIRAAFVNHRTSRADVDRLLAETLAAGRRLQPAPPAIEPAWQPWHEREARVRELSIALDGPEALPLEREVSLRAERATVLLRMGRDLDARIDHLKVLELAPAHLPNLIGLGRLLVNTGHRKAAQVVYEEAVKHHPGDLVCRVNLGSVLLHGDDAAGARVQYEAVLAIDPEFPQAHGGMYYALERLGEPEAAERHRRKAFGQQNLFTVPYRGAAPPIPVLLLVASCGGNTPIEKLLDDRVFQISVVVADYYDRATPLPAHRLVVNGIGDVEVGAEALAAADRLLTLTGATVLNHPRKVQATGRCENAERLRRVPGVRTASTALFPRAVLAGDGGTAALAQRGFQFPLLLRSPGFHMGQHFVRVEAPAALAAAVAGLATTGRAANEVLAIAYLDARGADGDARKYRVMFVHGRLYPLHLAIARNWKVHYFSADMADTPEHRAEEARFLGDMRGVLGVRAMAALEQIERVLGLDYGGIDFGLNREGNLLLFEANATMVVEQPTEDSCWDYRRAAVAQIHAAVRAMFLTSCRAEEALTAN
jgi:aromatic-L-amino-acid decarboxylase